MAKHKKKVGQVFSREGSEDLFLLSLIEASTIILINTTTGIRWSGAVKVQDAYDVTEEEWKDLTGAWYTFKRFRGVRGRDYA